jgi:hypothetical protein
LFVRLLFPLVVFALLASTAWAGKIWHLPEGGTSFKSLSLALSPRTAALSGAGVASPRSAGELFLNPAAPVADTAAVFGFSQILFSDKVGADLTAAYFSQPFALFGKGFRVSVGMSVLDYDDLDGYDEDGLSTGSYGAGGYAGQLGLAYADGPFAFGASGRFASQNIAGFNTFGFFGDAAASFVLNRYFRFAAAATNLGWIAPYEDVGEPAPLAVQGGVTVHIPLWWEGFAADISADLYRRADTEMQGLFGLEVLYRQILSFRLGYALQEEDALPSAGLGIVLGPLSAEYAYASKAAAWGNHHFGLGLRF